MLRYMLMSIVCITALPGPLAGEENYRPILPKAFDAPFQPRDFRPDIAVIRPTAGYENGRYEIEISLSETTMYDADNNPTRNYSGHFRLQSVKLPTDDFLQLIGREFHDCTDEFFSAQISMYEVVNHRREEQLPEDPRQYFANRGYSQSYPVKVHSIKFGELQQYAIQAQIEYEIDLATFGPPHPWAEFTSISPYQIAQGRMGAGLPGIRPTEWQDFVKLVAQTDANWKDAKFSSHLRVRLNHHYVPSLNVSE